MSDIISQKDSGNYHRKIETKSGISAEQLITVSFFLSVVIMIICLLFHEGILKLLFAVVLDLEVIDVWMVMGMN